jgi:hypothetical protein
VEICDRKKEEKKMHVLLPPDFEKSPQSNNREIPVNVLPVASGLTSNWAATKAKKRVATNISIPIACVKIVPKFRNTIYFYPIF